MTRIFKLVFAIYRIVYNVFRYTYPRLSTLAMYGLLIVSLIYDLKLTFTYVILGAIGFMFYTNPYIIQNFHPTIKEFLE